MSTAPLTLPAQPARAAKDSLGEQIASSKSQEIVFGIVGYAGSGPGWVATILTDELHNRNYAPRTIKISGAMKNAARQLGLTPSSSYSGATANVRALQDIGDTLRRLKRNRIGAGLAIREIKTERATAPPDRTPAFIIDQLKHPEEVELLRDVYGSAFYLIGILCPPDLRFQRLKKKYKGATDEEIDRLIDNDEAGPADEGQHVRKTLHLSDFFVNNKAEETSPLAGELARLVDIVASTRVVRPTRHERGMYSAWGAALRSSCLSRQVGAAILDAEGNTLSTGSNDVPRFGGGLYPFEDGESLSGLPDCRCFQQRPSRPSGCSNDAEKRLIYDEIFQNLVTKGLISPENTRELVQEAIEKTRVKDLIEFSRAVHAEMDAIVGMARKGGGSVAGTTLYTTTYPCHACARHIVAAGIVEVVYIEPYPKSLALKLHSDAITESGEKNKVHFHLFSGVAPRRFAALFEKRDKLKDPSGRFISSLPTSAQHRDPISKKSYTELENDIATLVDKILATHEGAA